MLTAPLVGLRRAALIHRRRVRAGSIRRISARVALWVAPGGASLGKGAAWGCVGVIRLRLRRPEDVGWYISYS